jgi:hypothetical protein
MMTMDELKQTHTLYKENIDEWIFRGQAYRGGKEFLETVIFQHTREEDDAYQQRLTEAYNFNYCATVINMMSHFLCSTPPNRSMGDLSERDDWQRFNDNADKKGTDLDVFMNETQKLASVYSTAGILCDKPSGEYEKDSQDIYPYLSSYSPINILDWGYSRIKNTNSYELQYIKLRDDFDSFLYWDTQKWERYIVVDNKITEFETGDNPIGIVPFTWLPNIRGLEVDYMGQSDITDVAYINASICRNASECEMSLKYSAFPMLLMPAETANVETDHANSDAEVTIGREAVLSFDPEYSNAKPSWLETPMFDVVKGTIEWLDFKIEETYRSCLLSSLTAQKDKAQTKSAKAIRAEQAVLNAILSKKADNMIEAERQIVRYFTKWQSCEDLYDKYHTSKTRQFNIEEMGTELENSFSAVSNIPSETFAKQIYKKIANSMLPNAAANFLSDIEKEIEENTELEEEEQLSELDTSAVTTKNNS